MAASLLQRVGSCGLSPRRCSLFTSSFRRTNEGVTIKKQSPDRNSQTVDTTTTSPSSGSSELFNETLKHEDYFGIRSLYTLRDLFDARVYMGHKEGLLNPHMNRYLFGVRQGVTIIDLEQTAQDLFLGLNFVGHVVYRGGLVLLVHRGAQFAHLVERTAIEVGEYAHARYWTSGLFTNALRMLGPDAKLPDVVVFLSTMNSVFRQHVAVREAAKMNIPSVGVVDTNCDPRLISYPIPGNDDSPASMELYCRLFKEVILRAKAERKKTLLK